MTGDIRRLVVVLGCLIVAFGGLVAWKGLDLAADVGDLNADVANLAAAYEAARVDDPALPPAEEVIDEAAPRDGVDGRDGRDGRDGKDGKDGETPPCLLTVTRCVGADGKDSTVPGPVGPPPSDDSLDAAIARYCAENDCEGDPGADSTVPGPQGPPGPAGTPCPAGYSWQPDTLRGDDVIVCTRDAA